MSKSKSILSHAAVGGVAAIAAMVSTYDTMSVRPSLLAPSSAQAQAQGQRATEVLTQILPDLNREMRVRVTERGNGSTPHRHPGHHPFGYVLEGPTK